jgi:uncharacterized protein (TIGR02453 family)
MWSPEAIEFLRELRLNNERDWFRANRRRYDELLVDPAQALAAGLADFGTAYVFRPYRDTRFGSGPPIKEQVAVAIGPGSGGWYFELSLEGLVVAAGLNRPAPDQLARYRSAIDDPDSAATFEAAVRAAADAQLTLPEPELKRAPRGYAVDHPRIDRLRLKELLVSRRLALGGWLHEPAADELVRSAFEAARPFVGWLVEHIGPTERTR